MEFGNLPAAYRSVCRRHADRILFRKEGITFGETWRRAESLALFLRREGYKKGDVIAILSGNSPEWCIAYMAITAIGAVALPLDTNLTPEQYRSMVKAVGARAAFVSASFVGVFGDTAVYTLEGIQNATGHQGASTERLSMVESQDAGGEGPAGIPLSESDIATLLFTSGTTGNPKIVSLSHGNILHVALVCTKLEEYTQEDATLAMLPFYHVYAFESTFMAPLLTGSAIILLNSLKGPDIIRALAENPITIFPAAPQMWELFFDAMVTKIRAQSAPKYRLFKFFLKATPTLKALGLGFLPKKVFAPVHDLFGHRMRFFISGGAPLKKEYFRFYQRMGFHIMEGYGLTETTGPIAIPYYRDAVAGSVGPPIPGNEVRIKEINADGIGEIWLKGKAVMAGYYRNDEANRAAFDTEGFFNTQDLGFVDQRGHIHITGRKKNVIVLDSGKNVYPEELELSFRSSPLIAEIAVFGRKIDGRETVCAVIVPAVKGPGSFPAIRGEVARLNAGLPAYRAVTRFALSADPLPRNSTRKVLIDEVIRLLEQGAFQTDEGGAALPRNLFAPAGFREEEIAARLKEKLRSKTLLANETLADHGIDSLGMIELIVHMEEVLTISVEMEKLSPFMTVEAFVRELAACGEQGAVANLDEVILRGPVTTNVATFWNPLTELVLFAVQTVSRLCWGLEVIHGERLAPDNAIIVANHQSNLDPLWLLGALPYRSRRRLFLTGKKELAFLRYPFFGSPVVFVDRRENVLPSLKAAADILRSGASLIIFPEGTRARDGVLGKFKSGAAYLAKHLDKKVIPVAIRGSFGIMPPGKILPRLSAKEKGALIVGEKIDPGCFDSVEGLSDHLREVIQAKLCERGGNG